MHRVNKHLERFSHAVTCWVGSSWAFAIAVAVIVVWAATGPLFDYSETWQLIINTGTTIVTFLMVFLIQRSQNKESLAVQVKLNELLAAQLGATSELINAEDLSEEQINDLHRRFSELSRHLQTAADKRSSHSIAEAQGALDEVHQTLHAIRQSRKNTHSKRKSATTGNGHTSPKRKRG